MRIINNYSQYMHNYEAFRVPNGCESLSESDKNLVKIEDGETELLLTAKSSRQFVKDRVSYNNMLRLQTEAASQKTQEEAQKQQLEEKMKVLAVFASMSKGNIVPAADERKLMEFDSKMYQLAKTSQMMAQNAKRKKEKSLWDDEEEAEKKAKLDSLAEESKELAGSMGAKSAEFSECQRNRVVEVEIPEAYRNSISGSGSDGNSGTILDISV